MSKLHEGELERLRTVTTDCITNEYFTDRDLRLCVWFHSYLHNELLDLGGELVGYTFRQKQLLTLLVVKARFEGIQRVVFVSANSDVGCMQILFRMIRREELDWKKDKYA